MMKLKKTFSSKHEIIERAICTWIIATAFFLIVQYFRPLLMNYGFGEPLKEIGAKNVNGFIPWIDPGGMGNRFPTLYRIMHNFTIPYVMIFYIITFIVIFWMSKKKNLTREAHLFLWPDPRKLYHCQLEGIR